MAGTMFTILVRQDMALRIVLTICPMFCRNTILSAFAGGLNE